MNKNLMFFAIFLVSHISYSSHEPIAGLPCYPKLEADLTPEQKQQIQLELFDKGKKYYEEVGAIEEEFQQKIKDIYPFSFRDSAVARAAGWKLFSLLSEKEQMERHARLFKAREEKNAKIVEWHVKGFSLKSVQEYLDEYHKNASLPKSE